MACVPEIGDFFEGPEKTLMLEFKRTKAGSLREIPDDTWSMILKTANCEILSKVASADVKKARRQRGVTAYLLSESSLFVYDNKVVLKTCGKTTPLAALPELLELGGKKGGSASPKHISSVLYSHPAYFRPELQEPMYRHFDHECRFLESYFPEGEAHHLGPQGRGVDLFVANYLPSDVISDFVQAEVYVTGLGSDAMEKFGQAKSEAVAEFWDAQRCEHLDEFRFEPYGYSANAIRTGFYSTVHASPQPSCAYMSWSTNAPLPQSELGLFLSNVAKLAEGAHVTVYLLSLAPLLQTACPVLDGYTRCNTTSVASDQFSCSVTVLNRKGVQNGVLDETFSVDEGRFDLAASSTASTASTQSLPQPQEARESKVDSQEERDVSQVATAYYESREELDDRPVMFVDTRKVKDKYLEWKKHLPRVQPCYAVKCNPTEGILNTLAELENGPGFDCASEAEMRKVLDLGVPPECLVYSNPCKQQSGIAFAREAGVSLMVFDNEAELYKIAKIFPTAELLLRVRTDDSSSQCPMSNKFGCPVEASKELLQRAQDVGLTVVGVSFHVGSGCQKPNAFTDAVRRAEAVMAAGAALGFSMQLLDIGGGFPGNDDVDIPFAVMAAEIRSALESLDQSVRVIAEPGRFFAQSCATLCAEVIAVSRSDDGTRRYYLNDGLYGSFNCLLYDHAKVTNGPFLLNDSGGRLEVDGAFFGPTCDGFDALFERRMVELRVGDILSFPEFGAYTSAAASGFNGMSTPAMRSF
jgi:ornithine decarboxylase